MSVEPVTEGPAPSIAPPFGRRNPDLPLRGRDQVVQGLVDVLVDTHVEPRVWVLHGLGGCGKTSIALELAHHAAKRAFDVWWVRAAEQPSLVSGLRAVARAAGANDYELQHTNAGDVLWRRLAVLDKPWLIVIDNADEPNLLALDNEEIAEGTGWLRPMTGPGMVVVTSREGNPTAWGHWLRLQPVPMLSPEDGADVLMDLAPSAGDMEDARVLSVQLGGLPLALWLAGSYLAQVIQSSPWEDARNIVNTFSAYQRALDSRFQADLFPTASARSEAERTRRTITSTWEMSLDLLDERGFPEARPLLRLLACFGEAPIPYQLLLHPAILSQSQLFVGLTGPRLWQVLKALIGVGLIELDSDDNNQPVARSALLHPLVRATNRAHPDIAEKFEAYRMLIIDLLEHATAGRDPENPKDWMVWQSLAPHCPSPLDLPIGRFDTGWLEQLPPEELIRLTQPAYQAARYLQASGLLAQAEEGQRAVLDLRRRVLGEEHPDTLAARRDLASVLRRVGQLKQAEAEYREVLKLQQQVLGHDHPDTLRTHHDLAYVLRDRGRSEAAEDEYRVVLDLRQQVLGEDHPDTLTTRHALAYVLRDRSQFDAAEAEHRAVLEVQWRVLGEDHPDTLKTRDALAFVLRVQGRLDAAEAEYRAVLDLRQQVLGEDHPDTLTTRHNLAIVLGDRGQLDAAEAGYRAVLDVRRRVLGEDHPYTLNTRHALAFIVQTRGQLDAAEAEYRAVLEAQQRVLDEDHPDILGTRRNLASLLQDRGQLDAAEAGYRAVLDGRRRVLGDEHPETLGTRHALAYVLKLQGRLEEAEAEYRAVLEAQQRVLGDEHPDSLATRRNLASLRAKD